MLDYPGCLGKEAVTRVSQWVITLYDFMMMLLLLTCYSLGVASNIVCKHPFIAFIHHVYTVLQLLQIDDTGGAGLTTVPLVWVANSRRCKSHVKLRLGWLN